MNDTFVLSDKILKALESLLSLQENRRNTRYQVFWPLVKHNPEYEILHGTKSSKLLLKRKVCRYKARTLILYSALSPINTEKLLQELHDALVDAGCEIDKLDLVKLTKKYPDEDASTEIIECVIGAIRYEKHAATFCIGNVNFTESDVRACHHTPDKETLGLGVTGFIDLYRYKN